MLAEGAGHFFLALYWSLFIGRKYWEIKVQHMLQAIVFSPFAHLLHRDGRVVRRCWVNFQCRGVLLIWIIVGQGPIALAVGAGGGCLDIFSLIYPYSFLSPSLWETARYRLKYCLKGPLSPKQPTNHLLHQKVVPHLLRLQQGWTAIFFLYPFKETDYQIVS